MRAWTNAPAEDGTKIVADPKPTNYQLTNHQPIVRQYDSVTSHTTGDKTDFPASECLSIRFKVERLCQ